MASAVSNLRSANGGNERFNAEAANWDAQPLVHKASGCAAKAILSKCSALAFEPKQVLELGCGTGVLSFLIAPHVERIVSIDAAQGMIDVLTQKLKDRPDAPKNILPVCVLLEDSEDANLPPARQGSTERQKFDLITSHLVLHHIPDLEPVLRTMYGCLRPDGGRVMLTDFEDFGPGARRFHPRARLDGVARHGIQVDAMAKLMRDVGFENVAVSREWTLTKAVERYPGEFEENAGKPADGGQFEEMEFPFVMCYGERRRV